jgi:hypothetical protein
MSRNFVKTVETKYEAIGNGYFNCPGDTFIFMAAAKEDQFLFVGQDDKMSYFTKSGKPAILSKAAKIALEEGANMSDFIVRATWQVNKITGVKHEKLSISYWITPKSSKTTSDVKRLDNDILAQMLGMTSEEIEKNTKDISCSDLTESESKLFSQKDYALRKEVLLSMYFNCIAKPIVETVVEEATEEVVKETPVEETSELTRQQKAALTRAANKLLAGK